jgi:hypothetical protein
MQTQFKLSQEEVNQAVQGYIAKHQRSRNIKVTSTETVADGVVVCAEVVAVERKPRAKKGEGKPRTKKTGTEG